MSTLDLIGECKPAYRRKLDYKRAYRLQYALLSDRVISLFDWKGLPFEQHELEALVQLSAQGYAGVVYSEKLKRWLAAFGSGVGVTEYPDKWITYTWACPLASGVGIIGDNCALVKNNSLMISSRFIVEQYAHLMAHALLSLQAALINSRATGYSRAKDDATAKQIKDFYTALEDGKTEVITTPEDLESIAGSKPIEFISDRISGKGDSLLDYWQLYQNLYKDFLQMIGVSKSTDKRERLIQSEVAQDIPLYKFNIEDMLDQRRIAAEMLSKIIGSPVTVDLAESVKQAQEAPEMEVSTDDEAENTGD